MKLGLIADIHGNSPAFKATLDKLLNEVDQVLFLGDLCGYYPFVNECASLWNGQRMVGVRGNHDEVLLGCLRDGNPPPETYRVRYGSALERSWRCLSAGAKTLVESWPTQHSVCLGKATIGMYHGSPWDPLEGRVYPDFMEWDRFDGCRDDILLLGHTHYPLVKRHGSKLIVNPGSVGQPRGGSRGACYATLDLSSGEVVHLTASYEPTRLLQDALAHDPNLPCLTKALAR